MNPKVVKFVLGLCILSLIFSAPTRAQVVGATVSGSITDPRGDAIPGAKVSAKNLATGVATNTTTNATGAFSIANLNPADSEISASAAGFSAAQTKVTLPVGAEQEGDLALTPGQAQQLAGAPAPPPPAHTTHH